MTADDPPRPSDAIRRRQVSLLGYFLLCLRVGLLSFGGGLSGWMYREVVRRRRWLADEEFFTGLGLSQMLPGANITNLTVYIGQRLLGVRGAAVGVLGLVLGPFFAVIALVSIYDRLYGLAWFSDFLVGVSSAAIGLLLLTAIGAARLVVTRIMPTLVMVATFVAIGILGWPLVPVVLCMGPISIALCWRQPASSE